MEEITLIGNLGNDPDVRYTNGGEKVVSFSLAVQAGKKAQGEALAHWYTCDAWERLADICAGRRPIRASGTGSPGRP